jgi:hypothetical protein
VIGTGGYIIILTADWRISPINPPDEPSVLPVNLEFYFENANPLNRGDVEVAVFLRYTGSLVAGNPVTMTATGMLTTSRAVQTVVAVIVSFKLVHSFPPVNTTYGMPDGGTAVVLLPVQGTYYLRENNTATIYFPTAGDFPPAEIVYTYNSTTNSIKPYVAPQTLPNAVHVEPRSQLQTEKSNRVGQGLAYALTYFGFIEAISLYIDEREKRHQKSSTSTPTSAKPKPVMTT